MSGMPALNTWEAIAAFVAVISTCIVAVITVIRFIIGRLSPRETESVPEFRAAQEDLLRLAQREFERNVQIVRSRVNRHSATSSWTGSVTRAEAPQDVSDSLPEAFVVSYLLHPDISIPLYIPGKMFYVRAKHSRRFTWFLTLASLYTFAAPAVFVVLFPSIVTCLIWIVSSVGASFIAHPGIYVFPKSKKVFEWAGTGGAFGEPDPIYIQIAQTDSERWKARLSYGPHKFYSTLAFREDIPDEESARALYLPFAEGIASLLGVHVHLEVSKRLS